MTKDNRTLFGISILALILLVFTNKSFQSIDLPEPKVSMEESSYKMNENFVYYSSIGLERTTASFLWVTTLMQLDLEHFKGDKGYSWAYYNFLSIATLAPHFYQNYLYGGQLLSIVKDDLFGAEKIYLLGLEYFPEDFTILLNAAFNYYFEIGSFDKGLEFYERAAKNRKLVQERWPTLDRTINNLKEKKLHLFTYFDQLIVNFFNTPKDDVFRESLGKKIDKVIRKLEYFCENGGKNNDEINLCLNWKKKADLYTRSAENR